MAKPLRNIADRGYKTVPADQVPEGVTVNVAGWIGEIVHSEPWSDYIWQFEIQGKHADGDPFTTTLKLPVTALINYKEA